MSGQQNSGSMSNRIRNQQISPTSSDRTNRPQESYEGAPAPTVASAPSAWEKLVKVAQDFGVVITMAITVAGGISAVVIFNNELKNLQEDFVKSETQIDENKDEIAQLDTSRQLMVKDIEQVNTELESIYRISDAHTKDIRRLSDKQIEITSSNH